MTREDARPIDIGEWVLAGGGAQGESYNHKADKSLMLKLFTELVPVDLIVRELELGLEMRRVGIPCPEPGSLVRYGDRYGIIFQRILNKKSFCRAAGDYPACAGELARRMAALALKLHSTSSEGTSFISALDYYSKIFSENVTLRDDEREVMEQCFRYAEDKHCKTLLHGDFHFGNVITDGVDDYFIDLGAISYGNPDFDNSLLMFLCLNDNDALLDDMYHMHRPEALEFWKVYKEAYFGVDAPSDEELWQRYVRYMYLRTLFFERDMGASPFLSSMRDRFVCDVKNGTTEGLKGYSGPMILNFD